MPRVPDYFPSASQAPARSPGLQAPGVQPVQDQTGRQIAGLGEGLARAGAAASSIADDWQDRIDQAEVRQHDNRFAGVVRQTVDGYRGLVGVEATRRRQEAIDALERGRSEIEAGLQNGDQREAFGLWAERRMQEALSAIDRHADREATVYEAGETKARFEGAALDAARAATSEGWKPQGPDGKPSAHAVWKGVAIKEANRWADLNGWAPDSAQRKALVEDLTTKLHRGVLDQMLADDRAGEAQAYLERNRGEISAAALPAVERAVQRSGVADKSLRLSRFLQSKNGDLIEQKAALDGLHEGGHITADEYDATWDRLRADDRAKFEQRTRAGNEALRQAEEWATSNRGRPDIEMPHELAEALDGAGMRDSFRLWQQQGGQWITDEVGTAQLIRAEDPEVMRQHASVDALVAAVRAHVNDRDLQHMVAKWYDAHQLPKPAGISEDRIGTMVRLALIDKGRLPSDRLPTPEEKYRAERIELGVRRRAEGLGQGGKYDEAILDKAIDEEFASTIRNASGEEVLHSSLSEQERRHGYWDTSSGIRVLGQGRPADRETSITMTDAIAKRLADRLHRENEEIRAFNAKLPPGSKPEPLIEITPARLAEELGRLQSLKIATLRQAQFERDLRSPLPNLWDAVTQPKRGPQESLRGLLEGR